MGIMKTTMEIADGLLQEARKIAVRDGTTLRALVERGLHHVLTESGRETPFRLRRASFKGEGLQGPLAPSQGEEVRSAPLKDRGT